LNLRKDLLSLGLFRGNRGGARRGREKRGREKDEQRYDSCLSLRRSDYIPPIGTMANAYWGRGAITSGAL
jgi:hypothetical protein